jgi:hypothetical protein
LISSTGGYGQKAPLREAPLRSTPLRADL